MRRPRSRRRTVAIRLTGRVGDGRFKPGGPRGRREAFLDYREYPPCARLRPYVDCYWSLSADQPLATRDRILPDGKLELAPFLDRAQAAGATILVPKTQISPETGFFALLVDSEGNRIGLQSPQ